MLIVPGQTLLFLDEIQIYPQALLALRYFYKEVQDLHVIGAGSLLEFAIEQVGLPVGRVQTLTIYPMSFAEFLITKGQTFMMESLCKKESFFGVLQDKLMKLLGEH